MDTDKRIAWAIPFDAYPYAPAVDIYEGLIHGHSEGLWGSFVESIH
jgi:hypothetical protein